MALPRNTEQARIAAIMGAKRALREFGWESATWIDPFEAIIRMGAVLMFQPLGKLYGAYLPREVTGGERPGVLVHSEHPLKLQRFTAAHELGHLWMRHEASLDMEAQIFKRSGSRKPPVEVAAETFAGHFLMPEALITHHMGHLGLGMRDLLDPNSVYSLALWSGVSFEATVYHLAALKLIPWREADRLAGTSPKDLKRTRLGGAAPGDSWADVWELSPQLSGGVVYARPGDEFALKLPTHTASGYLWQAEGLDPDAFEVVSDQVDDPVPGPLRPGSSLPRTVTVRLRGAGRRSLHFVERRPWSPTSVLSRLNVDVVAVEKMKGQFGLRAHAA